MIIQQKLGNINSIQVNNRRVDLLALHWWETNKTILRKSTQGGTEISLKFLNENSGLTQGDILFEDEQTIIAVEVLPCDCLVITAKNMFEMASICYEIGNKHLPLFFEKDELLVPFEQPLLKLLTMQGYQVSQEKRKLLQPLRTTVSPHPHNGETLFSKLMKLKSNHE